MIRSAARWAIAIVEAIRDGQSDTVARFNEFGLKMARVEAALDRH